MKPKRMNLLWIMCDQLRGQALGCNGDPNASTPNIDRLASEGVNFTRAFSQYPVCSPFRGGLVTGQHAHINGMRVHGDMLTSDRRTIAHAFGDAGYRTSWVGKWHLASLQGPEGIYEGADYWVHPALRGGFQDWFGFEFSNNFYRTRYSVGSQIWPPVELEGYQTDALTDLSLKYLSETAAGLDGPWFHCLSFESPHPGADAEGNVRNPAPPEFEARFRPEDIQLRENVPEGLREETRKHNAEYCAMVANVDYNVARVLDWLQDSGQADHTLVVFFADHGEMGGSHGRFDKLLPYEESIRIPLVMRLPGVTPRGAVLTEPISGIDLFPTCAGLCNVPVPAEVQGMDLSSLARGMDGPRQTEVLIQWLGAALHGFCDFQYRGIRSERYLYCVGTEPDLCLLFDNDADPWQMNDLFDDPSAAALRAEMHDRLCAAILRSGEDVPEFVRAHRPA